MHRIQVFQNGKHSNEVGMLTIGAALMTSQFAMIAHGFTDAVVWGQVRPAPFVWMIWGLAFAAYNISKTEDDSAKSH